MQATAEGLPSNTADVLRGTRSWLMLLSRLVLFAGLQAIAAIGFWLSGSTNAWEDSAAWWPLYITVANVIGIVLLMGLYRREGKNYWDIYQIDRQHLKHDLLLVVGLFVIAGPLSALPNPLLATALFGDSQAVLPLLFRPVHVWIMVPCLVVFAITQGLAELATYFSYAAPRIEQQGVNAWIAYSAAAVMLSLQHLAAPLRFEGRYLIWRGLMFLPFALFVGIVLRWRPRLLPYLAVIHVLMDLSLIAVFLSLPAV